jgi:thioester reductase-like protein
MIKGCIEMGMAPNQHIISESWAPVDYVSQAIVHLSLQTASRGQVFHLVNRRPLDWEQLMRWIAMLGYPLRIVDYTQWQRFLHERAAENALSPMKSVFPSMESTDSNTLPLPQTFQHVSYWNTVAGLEGSNISCPKVDYALLHTYFAYFLRSGFLTAPQSWS